MPPALVTITRFILKTVALLVFITGLIFLREAVHETFDPQRQPLQNRFFERAESPSPAYSGEPWIKSLAHPDTVS